MSVNTPSEPSSPSTPLPEPQTDQQTDQQTEPGFGWTQYAEQINGRFAMIGFIALLATEFFTQQDFFSWLGLR